MKWFENLRSKKMFFRILALLLAMAGLMFLLTCFFFRAYLNQSYLRRNREATRQLLSAASQYVDMAALDTGRAMQQLLWNSELTGAVLIPDEVSYQRKTAIVKALSTFVNDNPLVEHASLITYGTNMLYDESGQILSLENAAQRIYLPQYNSSTWAYTLSNNGFSTLLLTVDGSAALLQDFPTPETNGALLVELCEKELFQFLDSSLQGSADYLEVRDASGALLYACGEHPASSNDPQTLAGNEGWSFSYWQKSSIPLSLWQTLQIAALWALIFGTVSTAAAVLITGNIYRPIGRLREAVSGQIPAAAHETELDQVQRAYETALQQKTDLSHAVAEMAPIVRERLYKNLLAGRSMPPEYLIDRLACLKSPFDPDALFCVLAAASETLPNGDSDELMGILYQDLLQRRSTVQIGTAWECLLLDDYSLAVIAAFPNAENISLQKRLQLELCGFIESLWQVHCGEPLFVGCSKPIRGINGLHYAWQQARQDLHYRQYHGGQAPELPESTSCRQILNTARNDSLDTAVTLLEHYLSELRQLNSSERAQGYATLLDSMAQILVELQASDEKMGFLSDYYHLSEKPDHEASERLFRETACQALRLINYYGQRSRSRYVEQAKKYVQEHCTDSRLSLDRVAENVGINSAYLSRLFYELSDTNFVNYMNSCRVEHAKRLLRQSKISVQEAGYCCGFNSMQNFSRVFKRHTGITPGAYRKTLSQKEETS